MRGQRGFEQGGVEVGHFGSGFGRVIGGGHGTAKRKTVKTKLNVRAETIFERLAAVSPAPRTELDFVNPYTLVVAVALSAQATDVSVNKATKPLFAIADTPAKMVALGEEAVREHIKSIGLFRNKAKNVIALSQALIDNHRGQVPHDREALEALPGVGRKTANVVMTWLSAKTRSRSTRTCSASAIGCRSRPPRLRARSRTG